MIPSKNFLVGMAFTLISGSALQVSATEYVEYYKVGLVAVESQDWDRVSEMMQRAIEIQPDEKARVKKALFFKRYLPHYYLGKALYEAGDCAGAKASWSESESQGVVTRFQEYEQLKEGLADCGQQHSELESSLGQAKGIIASAGGAGVKARQRLSDLQATGVGGAEALSERLTSAESNLRQAEMLLAQAHGSLEDLHLSGSKAAEARNSFAAIDREASQWLQTIASEKVQKRVDLIRIAESGNRALKESEFLDPYPPGIANGRARVEDLIERVSDLDASAGDAELYELTEQLKQAISVLEHSTAQPPPELTMAAEAFLNGEYSEVLEVLGQGELAWGRASAQAHLLQAAALFALFHSQGGVQPELLEQARQEVLSCRRVDAPVPVPSADIFSPRFVEFFESQQTVATVDSSEAADS
jgi:tetratricopeptide (TPR) repeat protein